MDYEPYTPKSLPLINHGTNWVVVNDKNHATELNAMMHRSGLITSILCFCKAAGHSSHTYQ